jgi:anthranilate synthase component I
MITQDQFKELATQGHNRIPLVVQALADLDTPLSLYLKLTQGQPLSFLLESVVGGERFGRYSFVGLPARTLVRATGHQVEVVTDGQVVERYEGNPLDFVATYQARFNAAVPAGLPRFCGGLAGYFGYDTVRHIEPRLAHVHKSGGIGTPDILLLQCEELAVIDNLADRLYLIVYADPGQPQAYDRAVERLDQLRKQLNEPVAAPSVTATEAYPVERGFAKADYIDAVLKAKEYIASGDMMQVQVGSVSRRSSLPTHSACTVPCAASTPVPTCTTTTWAITTSWAPAPRSWCARSMSMRARRSPSAPWQALARVATLLSTTEP